MPRLALPLSTPRLSLEPLGADHADALFPVLSDPRTQAWIPPLRARSADELRARWAALEAAAAADAAKPTLPARLGWAGRRRSDGVHRSAGGDGPCRPDRPDGRDRSPGSDGRDTAVELDGF